MLARTLPMEYPTPQSITRRVACLLALAAASSSAAETPLSDLQKQWALATCAIRMSQNGDRHDILGGQEKTPANIVSARNLLHDWWNTAKREDLLESLEFLEKRGHRAQFEKLGSSSPSLSPASPEARFVLSYYRKLGKKSLLGWDFTRYIALCRWGYLAGYLNEQEAWDRIMPAARLLQKTFSSWQDLGANYLLGHEFWSPGDTASVIGASLDYTYRTLVMDLNGPWRRIPWGLDLTAGAPAGSLSSSGPTDGFASVYLISRPGGLTCFLITVIDRGRTRALVDGVQKMLSCRAIRVDSDSQTGPDWVFRGDCVQPDFANGAVIRATYPLEPFAAALREQHVTQMAVQVGHAISANSTLSPPAKYHWFRDGEENNAQTFDLGDPAPALLLQYGYTDARQNLFYQTTGLFSAAALLLAFGIAVSSRRERWSLFWCAQIVLPYLIWSGWLALVTGQDGLSMIRLAGGREGLIGALPAVAKLCLAPFALQFISSLIAFPVYRQLRGVEITWLQASHAALWRSALPAPIAALLLLATDRQTIMIPAIVIFGAVVCALFQFWFLHNLFRALRIGGSKVAEGELRDRVFALADQAKIKLVRFCVIPEGAWKSVHSMTTGDRSLLLAQPIIDRLSRPEVDAIVAHELAHLHLKHRSKAILLLLAAAFLVFTIESQIPREQGLAVLLVLMAGLLAAVVLVNAFRRQADYAADQLAVELTGTPEPLITGILRLDQLRGFRLYWSLAEELLFGHISALGRVHTIARRNGVAPERLSELVANYSSENTDRYSVPPIASTRVVYLI